MAPEGGRIRNALKGLVVHQGRVLLNRCENILDKCFYDMAPGEVYYELPGGGQNPYETLEEALCRELLEETGYAVRPLRLAGVYEELSADPAVQRKYPLFAHRLHLIFLCELALPERQAEPELDAGQLDAGWHTPEEAARLPIFPPAVGESLGRMIEGSGPVFLGSTRVD